MARLDTYSYSGFVGEQVRRLSGVAYYDGVAMGVPVDGSSDCAAAINNALSTIAAAGGGVLFLRAGTYLLDDRLSPGSNLVIQGVPNKTTLKTRATGIASGAQIIQFSNVSNVGLRDIVIDGNNSVLSLFLNNVQMFNVQNADLTGVRFQNMRGIAFLGSTNIRNVRIDKCDFVDCGANVVFGPGGRQAIAFTDATPGNSYDCSVTNCYFSNVGLDGISIDGMHRFTASGNRCIDMGAALVYSANSQYVTVVGNVGRSSLTTPYGNGIDCTGTNFLSVSGNTMYEWDGAGIGIFGCDQVSVVGNTCCDNGNGTSVHRAGIVVSNASSNVVVAGNLCTDTQGTKTQEYGLIIDPTNTNVVIGDNNFSGNLDGDIGSINFASDASLETAVTYVQPYVSTGGVVPGIEAKGTATDIDVQLKPKGSGAVDIANGALEMAGTAVINSSRHPVLRSYAKASLPSATVAAQFIYVTDDAGGATPAFSDGTNWRRVADRAVIS